MASRRLRELPGLFGNEGCCSWLGVGWQGSSWGREWGESQAHVSDAQLAALKAAEAGGPLRTARRPAVVLDEKRVLHVDVHQLLDTCTV